MKKNSTIYPYADGWCIRVEPGTILGDVLEPSGYVAYHGTLGQCLKYLALRGDVSARRHYESYHKAVDRAARVRR